MRGFVSCRCRRRRNDGHGRTGRDQFIRQWGAINHEFDILDRIVPGTGSLCGGCWNVWIIFLSPIDICGDKNNEVVLIYHTTSSSFPGY